MRRRNTKDNHMPIFHIDYHTESADTEIIELIPPQAGLVPRITAYSYTSAASEHIVYFMRAIGETTAVGQSLTGQAIIEFADVSIFKDTSGTDEDLNTDDYVCYMTAAGKCEWNKVSSLSGSAVTLANNLAEVVNAGAQIWTFGELARNMHVQHRPPVSATSDHAGLNLQGGVPVQLDQYNVRSGIGDPMLITSNNATAAGVLRHVSGVYVLDTTVS